MELRDLGAQVRLFGADGVDLGLAHVPAPVERDDIVMLGDGSPWRITAVATLYGSTGLDAICQIEPASTDQA
jgi:hypothetical protein